MKARLAIASVWPLFLVVRAGPLFSQPVEGGVCRPVSERKTEIGCWIPANDEVGVLKEPQAFWHLDVYQTRAGARPARLLEACNDDGARLDAEGTLQAVIPKLGPGARGHIVTNGSSLTTV